MAACAQDGEEDGEIYYMYVEDGQLDNQTILIDESQLASAGGHNVVLQVQSLSDKLGVKLGCVVFDYFNDVV